MGSHDPNPVDFPDIAKILCARVRDGRAERGELMVCGTGVGAVIATNKIRGIRSAVCHDVHSAHQAWSMTTSTSCASARRSSARGSQAT